MPEFIHPGPRSRDHFLAAVQQKLAAFEQLERDFRRKDCDKCAADLHLPVDKIAGSHYGHQRMISFALGDGRSTAYCALSVRAGPTVGGEPFSRS